MVWQALNQMVELLYHINGLNSLVMLLCAFAMWTVYKATDANAANNTAAVITNTNCFCIKDSTNPILYISFIIKSSRLGEILEKPSVSKD
jgi:hypothetical protein